MRYLFVTEHGILDSLTGELHEELHDFLLSNPPGGVIVGRNLYALLASVLSEVTRDHGFTGTVHGPARDVKRVSGVPLYVSRITYRNPKVRSGGRRFRPGSVKWVVLNLELFCESKDIRAAGEALVSLAERRGIAPRPAPGSFGAALLRASPQWNKKRRPAPWFISEAAREHLPGNFYIRRHRYTKVPRAYYLDQVSSHHTIVSTTPMPHPHHLHARGKYRDVEAGRAPRWIDAVPQDQVGLICAVVECDQIPPTKRHLYPPWAQVRGTHARWIWTPEVRLFDRRVRLRWVSAALTSPHADSALNEYANWALDQMRRDDAHAAMKPAMLAAYGMLAVRSRNSVTHYSVHGRTPAPGAESVELPLLPQVWRSTIHSTRVPSIQNTVARGVIEAECRTRSIEISRWLEDQGYPVVHIYADGVLVAADQLPLTIPSGWSIKAALTNVSGPQDNQIVSDDLIRLPGIPGGRRTVYLRRDPNTIAERPEFRDRRLEPRSIV
jgi:hypothetical protein